MIRSMILVASTLLAGATVTIPPELLRSDAPALEISTSVRPVTQDEFQLLRRTLPGMYRCSVVVHQEPGSNRVLGTKDIVLAPGESDEVSSKFGPLEVKFQARLSRRVDYAETTATVLRDGKIINKQTSRVTLERR
jgi:hypothetical protein